MREFVEIIRECEQTYNFVCFRKPKLLDGQAEQWIVTNTAAMGRLLGLISGCIVGCLPLLFIDSPDRSQPSSEELQQENAAIDVLLEREGM